MMEGHKPETGRESEPPIQSNYEQPPTPFEQVTRLQNESRADGLIELTPSLLRRGYLKSLAAFTRQRHLQFNLTAFEKFMEIPTLVIFIIFHSCFIPMVKRKKPRNPCCMYMASF
jgi:hypothetical protein